MLVNFSFKNHKSFRESQQFSMELNDAQDGWRVPGISSVAAIYGPNASGKSNFFNAVFFLCELLLNGFSGDEHSSIPVSPFLLDNESHAQGTIFFVEFLSYSGLRYKYHLEVDASRVEYETLLVYNSNRPSRLFERESVATEDGTLSQKISFGPSLTGAKKQIWDITRSNVPFLSAAAVAGNKELTCAYTALVKSMAFYPASSYLAELNRIKEHFASDDEVSTMLREIIRCADFGISDIRLTEGEPDEEVINLVGRGETDPQVKRDLLERYRKVYAADLVFKHEGKLGTAWLPTHMESDGTIAALAFFSVMVRTLETGGTALVDEIDQSLHPMLVRELVRVFADPATNPKQAQLIFTTHDATLITSTPGDRVLSRDQVWFVEKDDKGASELFPVTEYSPRKEDNLGRNYLNGVYDALPRPALHDAVAGLSESWDEPSREEE